MATSAMTDTKGYLADVPQEHVFWCCDGRILKNLRDLCDALGAMSDDTFAYHVNAAKNDFCNWVRDVIKDDALASDLLKAANAGTAVRVVTERIALLSSKPAAAPTRKVTRRKTTRIVDVNHKLELSATLTATGSRALAEYGKSPGTLVGGT